MLGFLLLDPLLPDALVGSRISAVAPRPDGSAWVLVAGHGARIWDDGRWGRKVDLPEGFAVATEATQAGDGALWVALRPGEGSQQRAVARLSGDRWRVLDLELHGLRASGSGVCAVTGPAPWRPWTPVPATTTGIVCVDGALGVVRTEVPVPVRAAAIAGDGGVWVLGEQVARLAQRVAAGR